MDNRISESDFFPASSPSSTTSSNSSFIERGKRIKMAAEMGLVESSRGRHWSRALRRSLLRKRGRVATSCGGGCKKEPKPMAPRVLAEFRRVVGEEEEEEEEIERRVRTLQKLVPGGDELEMEQLFEETADYIEALQGQVSMMRALAGLLGGLEREKRMMGG